MAAAVCTPLLLWFYRRMLLGPVNRYTAVLEEVKAFRITDWHLFAKCGEWICAVPALADGRVTEAGGAEVPLAWPATLPPPVDPICRPRRPRVAAYVTGIVLVGFLLHPIHHVDPAWFAVLGAIVLCVCDRPMEVENVMHVSVRVWLGMGI